LPTIEVRGRFLDSGGNPTTGGSRISAYGQVNDGEFSSEWYPDSKGQFAGRLPRGLKYGRLNPWASNEYAMRLHLRPGDRPVNAHQMPLPAIDSDLSDVTIVKYKAPVVEISIVDESGHAIDGAQMKGEYESTKENPIDEISRFVHLDGRPDGQFRSGQMMPDVNATFTATADGYEPVSRSLSLPEGGKRQITLKMRRRANGRLQEPLDRQP
jgi:hypothetical protein